MSNVKIALRVRPLSERELNDETSLTSVVLVEDDRTASVTNLKVSPYHAGDSRERVKKFTFDYCFDSSKPHEENSATQQVVFDNLGNIILDSIKRGQDACVLAYGQSASGKTHTMQGTEDDPGLAPRLCRAIYETSSEENSKLSISFFEIYNEKVRDLLDNVEESTLDLEKNTSNEGYSANQDNSLRVREHPRDGPYVEGLREIFIHKKEHLATLLKVGSSRRRTAATQRNPESSRSHAVLTVRKSEPLTSLTLLDLAGSERPSRVNQSVSRQKEGSNINKSLVALSNVISALAEANSRSNRYVPYRNSILTWLLRDTLSGGTTTVMIATVSPSSSCYVETVNTMRWASRAGRIQAGANTSSKGSKTAAQRSLKALRAEVARLRELLLNVAKEKIGRDPVQVNHQTTQVSFTSDSDQKENIQQQDECHENDVSECTIKEENNLIDESREQEGDDSLNSLASSRLSVASNETLSNPSSNLHSGPTEDILFGPRLSRTNSVHEFKPLPPLRNKNRQYSSHEALENLDKKQYKTATVRLNKTFINRLGDKEKVENFNSDKRNDVYEENSRSYNDYQRQHVPYEPFNKRAVIVASVTDRLYASSRRKEDLEKINGPSRMMSESKMNGSKKKLFDISYKTLRASRRFRIGISTETQTDKTPSIRVKEIGTDIQNDIEPIPYPYDETGKKFCNASVETERTSLLCKEASVGTINGSISNEEKCVETEKHDSYGNLIFTKTRGDMTDARTTYTTATQTDEIPPPRKKYSSFTKYLKVKQEPSPQETNCDKLSPKVFNISISHDCNQFENEGDSISDDSLECDMKVSDFKVQSHATPDLLNNHNSCENIASRGDGIAVSVKSHNENSSQTLCEDFHNSHNNKNCNRNINVNAGITSVYIEDNSKATNSNTNKGKTGVNINDRCDCVTNTGCEVIEEHDVTWNVLQPSVILNADSIKVNNNNTSSNRDNKMNCGNYHLCTSKSTQADESNQPQLLSEFLEDIYVPLPRICVTSDFTTERWPSMRNIILGRNENIYPYNIKLSPKKDNTGTKKRSKSVSWKIDKHDREGVYKGNQRRGLPKKIIKQSKNSGSYYVTAPPTISHYDLTDKDRYVEDYTYCGHRKYAPKSYFRGIETWENRYPCPEQIFFRIKSPSKEYADDVDARYNDTCVHYINATSNLIKEATDLVASLNKNEETNPKISENKKECIHSPVCKDILQTFDEKRYTTSARVDKNQPSTSKENIYENVRSEAHPRVINEELICTEDDDSDSVNTYDDVGCSSDDDLLTISRSINEIENELYTSLDRLEESTMKSTEYFETLPRRYSEVQDRSLTSIDESFQGPIPLPRTRRNPSKYLEELVKIRKELIECTKRDDLIYKQFQKEH